MNGAPLLTKDAFSCIDFGVPTHDPAVRTLASQLNAVLVSLGSEVPPSLASVFAERLAAYPGPGRRFIELFYVPAWSFLHWTKVLCVGKDDSVFSEAREAHALSLLLHLWDDHLMDGQMAPDMVALHMRTIAWRRFRAAVDRLTRATGGKPKADGLIEAYLEAHLEETEPKDLDAFLARFLRQIGIWRVAPALLGQMMEPAAADGLLRIFDLHAMAWRIMDDLQDARADCGRGRNTAVRLALSDEGRALWDRVETSPDSATAAARWSRVAEAIEARPAPLLRARIDTLLAEAVSRARLLGLAGLEAELSAAAVRRRVVKQLLRESPERT